MFNRKQSAHVFDTQPFRRLEISLRETDLVIRQDQRAGIIYYGDQKDANRFELIQEVQNLRIIEKKKRNFLRKTLMSHWAVGRQFLEVILPLKNFLKLTAEVSAGSVAVDNVTTNDFHFQMGSGNLTMTNVQAATLNLKNHDGNLAIKKSVFENGNWETQTGDLVFDDLTIQENLIANFAEGSLKMRHVIFKNAQITLGEGDVRINGFRATGNFNLSTNIGNLSLHDITAPSITVAAIRGNDLQNPVSVRGLPPHEPGKKGASFLTSAGHLDVSRALHISEHK